MECQWSIASQSIHTAHLQRRSDRICVVLVHFSFVFNCFFFFRWYVERIASSHNQLRIFELKSTHKNQFARYISRHDAKMKIEIEITMKRTKVLKWFYCNKRMSAMCSRSYTAQFLKNFHQYHRNESIYHHALFSFT